MVDRLMSGQEVATQTWSTVSELPPNVVRTLSHTGVGPTVIVATIESDGSPHTAPFGSMCAVCTRTLRFASDRRNDTYANIIRDGRVTVSLVVPPDIAVSVRGRARVLKEKMSLMETDAVLEIEVDEVKNDMIRGTKIETGITYSVPENLVPVVENYIAEVKRTT